MDRWTDFDRRSTVARKLSVLLHLITPRRVFNYLLNRIEYRRRRITLRSAPPKAIFDVANVCNLRCPLSLDRRGHPEATPRVHVPRALLPSSPNPRAPCCS